LSDVERGGRGAPRFGRIWRGEGTQKMGGGFEATACFTGPKKKTRRGKGKQRGRGDGPGVSKKDKTLGRSMDKGSQGKKHGDKEDYCSFWKREKKWSRENRAPSCTAIFLICSGGWGEQKRSAAGGGGGTKVVGKTGGHPMMEKELMRKKERRFSEIILLQREKVKKVRKKQGDQKKDVGTRLQKVVYAPKGEENSEGNRLTTKGPREKFFRGKRS